MNEFKEIVSIFCMIIVIILIIVIASGVLIDMTTQYKEEIAKECLSFGGSYFEEGEAIMCLTANTLEGIKNMTNWTPTEINTRGENGF